MTAQSVTESPAQLSAEDMEAHSQRIAVKLRKKLYEAREILFTVVSGYSFDQASRELAKARIFLKPQIVKANFIKYVNAFELPLEYDDPLTHQIIARAFQIFDEYEEAERKAAIAARTQAASIVTEEPATPPEPPFVEVVDVVAEAIPEPELVAPSEELAITSEPIEVEEEIQPTIEQEPCTLSDEDAGVVYYLTRRIKRLRPGNTLDQVADIACGKHTGSMRALTRELSLPHFGHGNAQRARDALSKAFREVYPDGLAHA